MKEKIIFMPRMAYALLELKKIINKKNNEKKLEILEDDIVEKDKISTAYINFKNPKYKVFVFEETKALIQTMIELSNKWKGNN